MNYINPYRRFCGAIVPEWLLRRTEVTPGAKLAYSRLIRFAGEKGYAYPSLNRLAERLGVCRRQAARYVEQLVEFRLIVKERGGHGRRGNAYRFLDHAWMTDTSDPPKPKPAPPKEKRPKRAKAVRKPTERGLALSRLNRHFTDAWAKRYAGAKYPFTGRDAKSMASIFDAMDGDEAASVRAIDRYLADSDQFIVEKVRHGLSHLANHLQRWASSAREVRLALAGPRVLN